MSSKLIIGSEVGKWVAERVGATWIDGQSAAIGWGDESIVNGVLYENYNKASIFAHIACEAPMVKGFIGVIFDYPFNQLKVKKIICPVSQGNLGSLNLVQRFGFERESVLTDAHPEGDIYIYTMRRENCRWIRG